MSSTLEVPHPLPEALAEMIARRFKTLSDPTRLRLLDSLRDGPKTVTELTEATGTTQQNASKHLGLMLQAGLVGRERDGTRALYEIADPVIFDLCELVCGGLRSHVDGLDQIIKGASS